MMRRWFSRDTVQAKIGIAVVLLLVIGGIGASLRHTVQRSSEVRQNTTTTKNTPNDAVDLSEKQKIPVTETKIETSEEVVPFTTTETYDGTLPKDTEVVRVEGANGKKIVKEEVKTRDGIEISRQLISETITVPPVAKIVAIGTKVVRKSNSDKSCDTHYNPCVRKVSGDVDCADIGHQVQVVTPGNDPLNLDRDNDGIGCESYPAVN